MSIHQPSVMHFGDGRLISPDGCETIPADLWPELELLILLDPEPSELRAWERRLEDDLGVTERHRDALRLGGDPRPQPWSVLCVSPHMERKVEETLREAGMQVYVPIETYLPKTTNVARSRCPWRPRTRPLIPGIIFAELSDDRAIDLARANYAVRKVMCRDGAPVKIPAIQIGSMILAQACGDYDTTPKRQSGARPNQRRGRRGKATASRWKSGQRVTLNDGPFAGFTATIMRADREDRINVLVSIFGRETPLEVDEMMIEDPEA